MTASDDRPDRTTEPPSWSAADRLRLARRIESERERTGARAAGLARAFAAITEAAALSPPDDEHDPDGATVGFERAQVVALLERARGTLAELDRAADRLAAGTYGVCADCERPIGLDRLQMRPTAERCIDCARADRRR